MSKKKTKEKPAVPATTSNVYESKRGGGIWCISAQKCEIFPPATMKKESHKIFRGDRDVWNHLKRWSDMEYFHNPDAGFVGNGFGFIYELTKMRQHSTPWLASLSVRTQRVVAGNSKKAHEGFFNGIYGKPKFKSWKQENRSFTFPNGEFNTKDGKYEPNGRTKLKGDGTIRTDRRFGKNRHLHLPHFGWVPMRMERELPDNVRILSATISFKNGRWYASLLFRSGVLPTFGNDRIIGIDLGSRSSRKGGNSIVLSDGTCFPLPSIIEVLENEIAKKQRELARKQKANDEIWRNHPGHAVRKKGAKREPTKAETALKKEISDLHETIANIRYNWLHHVTTYIALNYDYAVVEKLSAKGLTKSNRGTKKKPGENRKANKARNRGILRQGWGTFRRLLAYKMRVIETHAAYTSIDCCLCPNRDTASRKDEVFDCTDPTCDNKSHADWNAAINILERGINIMKKEGVQIPTLAQQELNQWKQDLGPNLTRILSFDELFGAKT